MHFQVLNIRFYSYNTTLFKTTTGYQRERNYRHSDGSYSAFGNNDPEGSLWLTAFVVKSFAAARRYIHIDESELQTSLRWLQSKQLENGCFPVIGTVLHKDLKVFYYLYVLL